MGRIRTAVVTVTALLLGAALPSTAGAIVACEAVGEVNEVGDGRFEYCVTVTWEFLGFTVPDRIDIAVPHLDDCEFYVPGDPVLGEYLVAGVGQSDAEPGCFNAQGRPTEQIAWVGEIRFDEADCWLPTLHVAFENTGATQSCLPLSDDSGAFCFTSYGAPLPEDTYYDVILIKAGDLCLVCDYTGPLPDCNYWSPVETLSWGTIKALYK
jgi:hypothetical protein